MIGIIRAFLLTGRSSQTLLHRTGRQQAETKASGGILMLDRNKFLVKGQTQVFSSKKTYEIADGDSGQTLGLATQKAGLMATLLGMALGKDNMPMTIEIRKKADDALVFSVRRKGFIFKKVQVLDGQGQVMGSYKAKMFSLSGGFHVYDQEGKHVADIKGKMF